jgi:hypothetical protein
LLSYHSFAGCYKVPWLRVSLTVVSTGLLTIGCNDGIGPGGPPPLDCSAAAVRTLAIGEHQIIDPGQDGACVRLPPSSGGVVEHLFVPLATAGNEEDEGVSAPYLVTGSSPVVLASKPRAPGNSPLLTAFQPALAPDAFHDMLRARERALSASPSAALFSQGPIAAGAVTPPTLNEKRSFQVCATSACNSFVETTATARSVGSRVAIFVDDSAPANGYTQPDLDDVQALFDQHLYPIDTTAFGVESDIDGNGVVIVLLTQHVNALSADCNTTNRVILGYFFGADLLPPGPGNPGSNEAEIFYGLVPDPTSAQCDIQEAFARSHLPATFIHEFQHMISFSQHVLVRDGVSEDTWLNEGLSHFAEELGGRLVPDEECPNSPSCFSEFLSGDFNNAFEYLAMPEDHFLIEPSSSTGELPERGANWLFVRWLADHFAADSIKGTQLTRSLDQTNLTGSANVEAQTGEDFSKLVGQWQLANYLDDLPGFAEATGRLRYKSWNFRQLAIAEGVAYPLVPDSTDGVDYTHSGVLRAGSGQHIRIVQEPGSPAVDLAVTTPSGAALPATIQARMALVRVR